MVHYTFSYFVVDVPDDDGPRGDGNGGTVRCFQDCLFTGHSSLSNYLFTDGHVKALKPTATYHQEDTNYWYRDASPLSALGRTTLTHAEAKGG